MASARDAAARRRIRPPARARRLLGRSGETGESGTSGDSETRARSSSAATLGQTGVFSGPSAGYTLAYEYWLDEVNAAGGIDGRQVEMILYDDESNPTVAQQLYQRLINDDEVDVLFAPYTTAVGGAVVPIVERAGVLMINPGFVGKEIHQEADLLVSTWPYQDTEYSLGHVRVHRHPGRRRQAEDDVGDHRAEPLHARRPQRLRR